ncbi:unnamed protein product [Clonostachys rhizophaga]|uniref:F-box domain-containing protein n=1 Tax=Clonostachys rhizophaga TaxID=160324 RepID=A0A9N9VBY5_9HYPO|nr:unnamed protein product [Clonostachys rhizophaga]
MTGQRTMKSNSSAKTSNLTPMLDNESDDDVLVDYTQDLALRSRKTSRLKRKLDRKAKKEATKPQLLSLTPELLLDILSQLKPADIIRFQQICKFSQAFVRHHETSLVKAVISRRYSVLSRCFPRPIHLKDVDPLYHPALLHQRRQKLLSIHRKPYSHVAHHDPALLCSCLTCIMAWNNLCLIVDLAHWTTTALSKRQPIPMIPRGENPPWNVELVEDHAAVVRRALASPLWYALILQRHLQTTIFGIRRYANKGEVPDFELDDEDVSRETDEFCARSGSPSYEFPITRDTYYGLKTYLPNRLWDANEGYWKYQPSDQHFRDLKWVQDMADKEKEKIAQGPRDVGDKGKVAGE